MAETTDDRPEVWMPVRGYDRTYEVSNLGKCRRIGTGRILVHVPNTKGYLLVSLSQDGVAKNHAVHRIVLAAFCGEEPFDGAQAAHNDGNPKNCRLNNLRWASPVDNQADRKRHGTMCRGSNVFGAILLEADVSEIRKRIHSGERNPSIASDYGVSISTIHLIRHNRTWRHVA